MYKYNLESLLRLYAIPGVGPARLRNLLSAFGSAEEVLKTPLQRLIKVPGIENNIATTIRKYSDSKTILDKLKYIDQKKINITTCWDKDFPANLKNIYDPPVILFYKGDLNILKATTLAVVGMRAPSSYGIMVTEKLCRELIAYNCAVISGLARGVDTVAHRTALKHNGKTVAVMGSGMDNIYPPENRNLAENISEKGLLISEYMIGAIPDPGNFPRRNRIISGLSMGVIVTEAGLTSGALNTAYQALDQNREVFAVPGPINSRKSIGTNQLIRQGAVLVQETSHVIEELKDVLYSGSVKSEKANLPELTGFEKEVYLLLSDQPQHVDALAKASQRGTAEILSTLLTLELMGIVRQISGKMFIRMPL